MNTSRRSDRGRAFRKIAEDGISDSAAQWVGAWPLPFAMRDGQHFSLPVEVVQPQRRDFARTKAVYRQQQQQGPIADVNGADRSVPPQAAGSRHPKTDRAAGLRAGTGAES